MLRNTLKHNRYIRTLALRYRLWRNHFSYKSGHTNKILNNGIRIATRVQIQGSGNLVEIMKDAVIKESLIKISGSNCVVRIGENAYVSGAELWIEDNGCELNIGKNTFVGHHSHFACTENGSQLKVGNDCMISSYVQIRTGDSHSVLDADNNRINAAADVEISDHCWLGQGVRVLKGTFLHPETIVATGAIVHGLYKPNVILAGNPAKIIRENVTWDRRRL